MIQSRIILVITLCFLAALLSSAEVDETSTLHLLDVTSLLQSELLISRKIQLRDQRWPLELPQNEQQWPTSAAAATAAAASAAADAAAAAAAAAVSRWPFQYEQPKQVVHKVEVNKTALALLEGRRQTQLFSTEWEAMLVNPSTNVASSDSLFQVNDPVTMVSYHKTGYEYSLEFAKISTQLTDGVFTQLNCLNEEAVDWTECARPPKARGQRQFLWVHVPTELWEPPKAGPIIHFVRDIPDIICSGYRYHMGDEPEYWEFQKPGRCHACCEEDRLSMFDVCNGSCSYAELLHSLDEEHGAIVELFNERSQVQRMLDNTYRWMNSPRVLHISMKHLEVDYGKTLNCVNRFLGTLGFPEKELDQFNVLDIQQQKKTNSAHVTSGQYDNSKIMQMLKLEPVWGPEFAAAGQVLSKIFQRQFDLYGCPVLS